MQEMMCIDWNQWRTIIMDYTIRPASASCERVGVTSCLFYKWTSLLVSVASHLTSQVIEYHLMHIKCILNISIAQHLQPTEHYVQFSMLLCSRTHSLVMYISQWLWTHDFRIKNILIKVLVRHFICHLLSILSSIVRG